MSHTVPLRVLITGATGYIGGRLLKALEKTAYRLRCLARQPQFLRPRVAAMTEVVRGDVLDLASLREAMRGVHTAYYLVHSMGSTAAFEAADRQAAQCFGAAAQQAGVQRIIYLGGLGESHRELSPHLRSRQEVGEILRESGIAVLEFRTSIVIGSGSVSFEIIRALVERLPVMITPRWVSMRTQPIAIEDVVAYLLAALELPGHSSQIFEVGGADQVCYGDLMREYARQRGLRRYMIPMPVLTPRLSSLWLGLVTPVYARIGRQLIDSIRHATVVQDDTARRVFPLQPMGVRQAIARALCYEDHAYAETRWSDALSTAGRQPAWGGVRFGTRIVDSRVAPVARPPALAFKPICQIGGARGWYYANWLWRLRGWLDLLVGGVGLRRGRRDPAWLVVGDTVDFWRVEAFEPNRRLRLMAEMRLPGRAWLEFEVEGDATSAHIRQTAIFDPIGVGGRLYWYALYPLHRMIFANMLRGIVRASENEPVCQPQVASTRYRINADTVSYHTHLAVSAADAFRWHAHPGALERLTPPWAPVQVLERTGDGITDGARVTLGIRLGPLRWRWVSEHYGYRQDEQFCDVQITGPFARWEHMHRFTPDGAAACVLEDRLTYALPLGVVAQRCAGALVRRKLDRLFAYRHRVTQHDLAAHGAYKESKPLHVLVTGASGLVGSALVPFLTTGGHRISRLVRSTPHPDQGEIPWHPETGGIAMPALEGVEAVVHLAGENIATGRWTANKKARIRASRLQGTRLLCEALAQLAHPPKVLVSASAIGYYGDRGAESLYEASRPGTGFLAEVCQAWEAATAPAVERGIRVVHLRFGIVLSPVGGALVQMLMPFKLGAGGVIGNGRQYLSWIALDDAIGAILHAVMTPSLQGPVNAVAPQPLTNREFTRILGRVLRRPALVPLPALAARFAFGEMAEALLLASTRVEPRRLLDTGYVFHYPDLDSALGHLLGKPQAA